MKGQGNGGDHAAVGVIAPSFYKGYMKGQGNGGDHTNGGGGQKYADQYNHSENYYKNMYGGKYTGGQGSNSQGQGYANQYNKSQDYWKQQYAGKWSKNGEEVQGHGKEQSSDCKTIDELNAWREGQYKTIEAFVPQVQSKKAMDRVAKEYEENKERIENPPPLSTVIFA